MIRLFYVKDNYIVAQEKQEPIKWGDIQGNISGNTQLQEAFNDLQNGISTNAQGITDEIQSRIDGDTNLQNQIDDNKAAIEQEIADRKDADNVLQDNIDAEATRATNVEATLNDKIAVTNTNISENYYKKIEVDSKIDKIVAGEASLQNYYTKVESDNKYALKGDVPTDVYTKQETDLKLSNKADKSEIPTIPLFRTINGKVITGDTTNIVIEGGSGTDLTNYYTKTESDGKYALKGDIPTDVYTKTQVDNKLSEKLDVTAYTVYDDSEIKAAITNKQDKGNYVSASTLNNYYTKTESDNKLANKQDKLVSGQNIKRINGQSIVGSGDITIEGGGSGADMSNYYTKTEVDNKLANKLDATVDSELSNTSRNPVQNKAIAIKLAELETVIDDLKKKSDDIVKVTFISVDDNGTELKPTYTVTYGNTTITTLNSELYVEKDVTMTVVPSDIDGLITPVEQTKKITEDTTFNFEYDSEVPVGTNAISFRTSLSNYTANVVNDSSQLTSMVIDNVSIPLEQSGVTKYTFANAGLHTGTYSLKEDETYDYKKLFYNCKNLTSIVIPDSVTSIGTNAFMSCIALPSVTLPDSVTSIGNGAFYSCYSLTNIVIPDSVTSIGDEAFNDCYSLSSATLPDSVTSIGEGAFYNCSGLTNITIPDSVTSIPNNVFFGCYSLTGVTIGNSVTSIGKSAFGYCTGLTGVTIGNSVTSIGWYTFRGCSSLTSVTLPDSVTSIGLGAFEDCSSLTTITVKASTPPTLGDGAMPSSVTAIYVPSDSVDVYKSASGWRSYASNILPIQE